MARLTYRTHLAHLTCLTPLTLKPSNIATKSNARRNQPKPVDGDALRGLVGAHRAGLQAQERVLHTASEYVSFIVLIGSLFVVSGGIHINVKGEATPAVNVLFLLIGAVVANLLGTTGASMLLIRPWLRMNKYRLTAHH